MLETMATDTQGLEILDEEECIAQLSSVRLGRVALSHRAMPVILPVAFGCLERDVIFSVQPGILARAADEGHIVCFQADWADRAMLRAWSVSVIGQLAIVTEPVQLRNAQKLSSRWRTKFLRCTRKLARASPTSLHGRRSTERSMITVAPRAPTASAYRSTRMT